MMTMALAFAAVLAQDAPDPKFRELCDAAAGHLRDALVPYRAVAGAMGDLPKSPGELEDLLRLAKASIRSLTAAQQCLQKAWFYTSETSPLAALLKRIDPLIDTMVEAMAFIQARLKKSPP